MENKRTGSPHVAARIVEQNEKSLQLEWTLVNDSDHAIVVLRHLVRDFDEQGKLKVQPNLIYVSVEEKGNIDVSKKLLRIPERGIHVEIPFAPLGEELPPGKTLTEKITLPVPITPWDPYGELIQLHTGFRATKKVEAKVLRFHLGVYRQPPKTQPWLVDTALGKLIFPNYDEVLPAQTILDAPPIPWTGDAFR